MGMIGYAMNHAEEHERSEGIATLEKREDINVLGFLRNYTHRAAE